MSEPNGLILAYDVEATGRARRIGWDELDTSAIDEGGFRWIHLELESEAAQSWVRENCGLSELEIESLFAEETRPRSTPMGEGLLLILRGVNLNPGADPEDMVAVRIRADADRIITVRRRRLLALQDLAGQLDAGRGPRSVGEFIAELGDRLVGRMAGVLAELDEGLDDVEEQGDEVGPSERRRRLLHLRREAIALRRYLSPQRDALSRLSSERIPWLSERERMQIREVLDRTTRYVEDLESARERAAVTQEELASRTAEQLNQRMYALSIVAGVFLPLSFVTGLLGINVAGIPGSETWWAFAGVCVSLSLLTFGEILLFRRLGWL